MAPQVAYQSWKSMEISDAIGRLDAQQRLYIQATSAFCKEQLAPIVKSDYSKFECLV